MAFYLQLGLARLFADRRGITAVEYAALAVGVISVTSIGAAAFGEAVQSLFAALRSAVIAAANN